MSYSFMTVEIRMRAGIMLIEGNGLMSHMSATKYSGNWDSMVDIA